MRVVSNKLKIDEEKKLTTLSERLVHALNTLNITQAELARRIKIKPQAIHYLCNSRSKKSGFTYEIADALNINSLWLGNGEGSMQPENNLDVKPLQVQQRVPLLEWKKIKHLLQKNENSDYLTTVKECVFTNLEIGKNSFSFRLNDKSMYPRFDQDTIVIINPERIPKDKDFVVIYLKEIDDIIFRQYEYENDVVLLKPVNMTMYKTIKKAESDIILGTLVEARWQG